jgi:adenylate cyclase
MNRIVTFGVFGAIVGILYTQIVYEVGVPSALRGAYVGTVIASFAAAFEVFGARGRWKRFFLTIPFTLALVLRTGIYTAIILGALISQHLVAPNEDRAFFDFLLDTRTDVVFSLIAAFVFNFVFAIHELLGPKVLFRFLIGRYHRPTREERVFLFLDMVGSTRLTEQLGDLTFHAMLNDFYIDLTDPILRRRGEIHRYVGDEMVASWPVREGLRNANCILVVGEIVAALEARRSFYENSYGAFPAFRAGLHLGPVVIGEMGSAKKEFVFVGDAVNATARIEQACRTFGKDVIASGDLIDRLGAPPGVLVEDLGEFEPRGRSSKMRIFALSYAH